MTYTQNYEETMARIDLLIAGPDTPIATPESTDRFMPAEEFEFNYKTLEELRARPDNNTKINTGRSLWHSNIVGIVMYSLMALVVAAVFLLNGSGEGAPRDLFGFSAMRVLTGSMQGEIPQNSLIITRRVDPNILQVGDDITFFLNEDTVVTHRIVTVHYDFENSAQRAFQTQGIENRMPDSDLVIPENIVGRVIFSNLTIGRAAYFIQENLLICGLLAALILGLFVSMRMIFGNKRHNSPVITKKSRCHSEPAKNPVFRTKYS